MKHHYFYPIYILSFFLICFITVPASFARKVSYTLSPKESREEREEEMTAGSFMVASQCPDCNNGYTIDQIGFSGFDKKIGSSTESFFITNNTNRTMTALTLYVDYLTLDGRQLTKKFYKLNCNIPPGETRKVDIESWDTQRSFYYEKSAPAHGGGTPFTVIFDPVAYYLQF